MSLKLGLSSVVILALALTGCASTGKEWVGRPVSEVVAKWGIEDKKVITPDGRYEIRRWHKVDSYTVNEKVGQSVANTNFGSITVDHYQQRSGNLVCYTYLFSKRKENIVIGAEQRGTGCSRSALANQDPEVIQIIKTYFKD